MQPEVVEVVEVGRMEAGRIDLVAVVAADNSHHRGEPQNTAVVEPVHWDIPGTSGVVAEAAWRVVVGAAAVEVQPGHTARGGRVKVHPHTCLLVDGHAELADHSTDA